MRAQGPSGPVHINVWRSGMCVCVWLCVCPAIHPSLPPCCASFQNGTGRQVHTNGITKCITRWQQPAAQCACSVHCLKSSNPLHAKLGYVSCDCRRDLWRRRRLATSLHACACGVRPMACNHSTGGMLHTSSFRSRFWSVHVQVS